MAPLRFDFPWMFMEEVIVLNEHQIPSQSNVGEETIEDVRCHVRIETYCCCTRMWALSPSMALYVA